MAITSFRFSPGTILSGKYKIIQKLGAGYEGEVYLVSEKETGVDRSIKLFFPERNKRNETLKFYAKKLHKLRSCSLPIQYYAQEKVDFKGKEVHYLVSEYVDGELLSDFLKRQPGKRLHPFQAVHLLYALAKGMEEIHRLKEYHGDLHAENIIIQRHGLGFELKLVDLFQWKTSTTAENIQDDVYEMIKIFYTVLGGTKQYAGQPDAIKSIILGRNKTKILKRFRSAAKLRAYLENLEW